MGKLTYEDYCLMPNDGKINEIIDGEHYNHPSPPTKHQYVSLHLDLIIAPFIEKNNLGYWYSAPLDVLLGPHDVVQPDKLFISKGNERILTEANIKGVPDLLVEIVSRDEDYDKKVKFKLYEQRGVRHYWIVDPHDEVLFVYKLEEEEYKMVGEFRRGDTYRPEIFPNLELNISDLFVS